MIPAESAFGCRRRRSGSDAAAIAGKDVVDVVGKSVAEKIEPGGGGRVAASDSAAVEDLLHHFLLQLRQLVVPQAVGVDGRLLVRPI